MKMTITVTKTFSWSMAHLLEDHKGLCKNVHGHDYKMYVTVERIGDKADNPSDAGMVIDFQDLKKVVNVAIIEPLDHAFVFNLNDETSVEIADFLGSKIRQKIYGFPFRPTAENMAKQFFLDINAAFSDLGLSNRCKCITLYETETSSASYAEEDHENKR